MVFMSSCLVHTKTFSPLASSKNWNLGFINSSLWDNSTFQFNDPKWYTRWGPQFLVDLTMLVWLEGRGLAKVSPLPSRLGANYPTLKEPLPIRQTLEKLCVTRHNKVYISKWEKKWNILSITCSKTRPKNIISQWISSVG